MLPRICAQLSRRRATRTIGRSVSRFGRHPRLMVMDTPQYLMAQLMPTKVVLTLTMLLSCLVFVTRKHAMLQVHSRVRGHGDKALRWPQQEATLRGECMPMVPCIYCRLCVRRLDFIIIGVASIARLVSRESHERPPKVPHEPTRCYCCLYCLA